MTFLKPDKSGVSVLYMSLSGVFSCNPFVCLATLLPKSGEDTTLKGASGSFGKIRPDIGLKRNIIRLKTKIFLIKFAILKIH
jgi:hypothetical protein